VKYANLLLNSFMDKNKQYITNRKNVIRVSGAVWYFLIVIIKLSLGILLLMVTIGAITVIIKNFTDEITILVTKWQLNVGSDFLRLFLGRLKFIDEERFKQIGFFTAMYSGIVLTEGIGLLLQKRWAEYFTIIATSTFIPFEIYKIIEHFTHVKIVILVINILIIYFLITRVKHNIKQKKRV